MLTNTIRSLLASDPFTPFTMSLTSRTTVRIARADGAAISESGEALHVFDTNGREISLISIRHIVSITLDPPPDEPVVVA